MTGDQDGSAAHRLQSVLISVEQLRRGVPGGIGTYAQGLITGLSRLDQEERPAITLQASRSTEQPDPLRCYGLPLSVSVFRGPVATRLWDRGFVRLKTDSSVVHCVSLSGPSPNAPLVMMVHDLAWRSFGDTFPRRGREWHEAALRRAARRAAHFVTPSSSVADALVDAGVGISRDRIDVIEEGADHLPPPDEVGMKHLLSHLGVRGPFLLTAGTLEPRKNLARLVEAYAQIRRSLPEPWPLVIVGPQGWGGSLRQVRDGVLFAGKVSPAVLAALYGAARTVAYVPLHEGFGLPVVEAMAENAPVVSSDVPSAGGATQLVDATDVESIASGLLTVSLDEDRRAQLRSLGELRVAPLTWTRTAREHVRVWSTVAERRQ